MDVTSAINRVQALWLTVSGVRAAPAEPPEKLDPLPMAVTFEHSGELDVAPMYAGSFAPQTGTLWSELHVSRADLPRAIRSGMSFRDEFLRALQADPNLNGTIMIISPVRWTFLPMEWNGIQTVGYRFEIDFSSELTPS